MSDARGVPGIAAETVSAAIRVYADRVHDFARRLGCTPDAAVQVVESSALDLLDAAGEDPGAVRDVAGWFFARAWVLCRRAAGGDLYLPLGGGVLSADDDQTRLAQALEALLETDRVPVLLRDSYVLPAESVAVALGTDADTAIEAVGRSRLAFLQATGEQGPILAGHPVDLAGLARLGEGGQLAARDATTRRHAQSCALCRDVLDAQERAHRMLTGLTVVALPDAERDRLLARTDVQARTALPSAAALVHRQREDGYDDEPRSLLTPVYVVLALILAVLIGVVAGVLLSRHSGRSTSPVGSQPVSPAAVTAGFQGSASTVDPVAPHPVRGTSYAVSA
ncbi:MAG: hypothetical protein JWN35_3662 [Frankiales bacterium]|nr:hypothetical protein [Frankiales bacterium]